MKHKENLFKKISTVLLVIMIGFLFYIHFSDPHSTLMKISGNSKVNYYPYVRLIIALILSILLLLLGLKKYKIYSFLHLLWLIPVIWVSLKLFFGIYNTEKTDYFLSPKISQEYSIHPYELDGWLINEIRIKTNNSIDTLYASVNPTWEAKKWNQAKNTNNIKVFKSFITGYYYVSIGE